MKLEKESESFGDILQIGGLLDSNDRNNTLKMAGLLNWLHRFCPQVDYVLKVDDDVFVNMRNLGDTLTALNPNGLAVYGVQVPARVVARNDDRNQPSILLIPNPNVEFVL